MSANYMQKHSVFQMKFIPSCWIKNIPYISFFCEMKFHPIDIWKFCKLIHMNTHEFHLLNGLYIWDENSSQIHLPLIPELYTPPHSPGGFLVLLEESYHSWRIPGGIPYSDVIYHSDRIFRLSLKIMSI